MAGILHPRRPGLILPGSAEWREPGRCDFTSDMMMAGGAPDPTGPTDPYFSSVRLLIQPKTGDTTVKDYGPGNHPLTLYGDASISTGIWSGYGGILFPGVNGCIGCGFHSDYLFTGDFCWEFVINLADLANNQWIFSKYDGGTYGYPYSYAVSVGGASPDPFWSGKFRAAHYGGGSGGAIDAATASHSAGVDVHTALVRDTTSTRLYVGGALFATAAGGSGQDYTDSPLNIGNVHTDGTDVNSLMRGRLRALRLTAGNRGYTGSTIPNAVTTGPFPTA